MYEPTEREISIATLKTLNKIEDKLNWLIGIGVAIVVALVVRA